MRTTTGILIAGLAAAALAAEPAALKGSWRAVRAERDGAPAPELVGHRLRFAGDRYEITRADHLLYTGTYRLDEAASPAWIDFVNDAGQAAGVTWEGIYRLDSDATLTIVDDAPDPAKGRPSTFAAPAGSGHVMLVFER